MMTTPEDLGADGTRRRGRSFAQMLVEAATRWPHNEALVIAGIRWDYSELLRQAARHAVALRRLGVRPDDHVGVLLPNSVEFVAAFFGTSMIGATIVPFNTRFKADELAYVIADSAPRVIVTTDAINDYVDLPELLLSASAISASTYAAPTADAPALVALGSTEYAGVIGEAEYFDAADAAADLPATPARYSAVVYTSGTTSRPRGALLTPAAFEHWSRCGALWEITSEDRFWDPCPLFHIAAIGPLVWTIDSGAAFISDTYFDPGRALAQIEAERATLLYPTYPPIMRSLMTHESLSTTDLSAVRAFLNVAPPDDLRAMQAAIPHAAEISLYGSTEGGPVTMHSVADPEEYRMATNGRATAGVTVAVFDAATGRSLPVHEVGEIRYRGPNTFSGYLNDPEKTAASLDAQGWVHTGDGGWLDHDGTLHYVGRVNDMIKVGGENVAPAEVEEVLGTHPAVKLCQAVGIPDERLVEVVAAFVELVPGATAEESELLAFARERMAKYKVPRVIRVVTEWPMSATKIQRGKLRELLIAEGAEPA